MTKSNGGRDEENYDWRDPSKPRNPEDDVIIDGWRRRKDGTFEKIEPKEEPKEKPKDDEEQK